jgi:hypothetical protein
LKSIILIGLLALQLSGCSLDEDCKGSQLIGTWLENVNDTSKGLTFGDDCSLESNYCDGDGSYTKDTEEASGTTTLKIEKWNSTLTSNGPLNCLSFKEGNYDCNFSISGEKGSSRTLTISCQ